ncbi:alanine dehydrogenase [Streptomonospora litoralis]|uniref:Alanine dehydrogenase n=1 Tax=Streptomonospora litoralis TaxID=2498135 RepID=A0A4P6PZT8_9ACTN|nr:alanine dehydrogenase [Streptomonospora litoralis]QBI53715.1 Alanine dehydrogenase [Streptomonospora litoralis]
MRVGVPSEIKNHEYRVAITPAGVHELVTRGHSVAVQSGAGRGSSISDEEFTSAGARVLGSADDVWAEAELVLKVKEPVPEEYHRMRPGQTLFTYLHLAASKECTDALLEKGVTGIAYETVQAPDGSLPLLAPMSEVAGRLAPQVGAFTLQRPSGGRGRLMGGVPGVAPARVTVVGAGVAGLNATRIAVGMGADVTLLDLNVAKLRHADDVYQGRVRTVVSNAFELESAVLESDMVVGAVLIPGAKAPKLVSNELVSRMRTGAVLVDIAIDQGGCFADSRPTTHDSPTFDVHETVFYCVANMPGAVPNTSTHALTKDTLRYAVALAGKGWRRALAEDPALAQGLNTHDGTVTNEGVAEAHGLKSRTVTEVLAEGGH